MTAESIAKALGGRRVGAGWMAHCPAHDDRTPSLSLCDTADGGVRTHCFAGCERRFVLAALRARGLWPGHHPRPHAILSKPRSSRSEAALKIWHAAKPSAGTPVETYLRARGISIPPPPTLRFHHQLKHPSGGTWPAMVALVTRGSEPVAIHRTFLSRNGKAKSPVEPQKMMLGPCRGGAVRLAESVGPLLVGEGIETCLSAMQATGHAAWAALSASGLRTLELPTNLTDVIILADGDAAGESAARCAGAHWARQGRRVRIAHPPRGEDFNDVLVGKVRSEA